jgi:hypothetical protein
MRGHCISIFRQAVFCPAIIDDDKFWIAELDITDSLGARDYRLCFGAHRTDILLPVLSYAAQKIIEPMFILA